jgi:hypothetical protein
VASNFKIKDNGKPPASGGERPVGTLAAQPSPALSVQRAPSASLSAASTLT